MGSVMRRTTAAFTISSEKDTDNSSLNGNTKVRSNSTQSSPPLPPVVTPSPIAKLPATEAHEAAAVAPVDPPVESTTLNASEPAEPAITTEELVDEPTSYFGGPMAESIKDFDPVDHTDNKAELNEGVVHGNANDISPESHHEQHDEAVEYNHGDVIPTTTEEEDEVVPENANNVVLPEPDLGHHEESQAEALHNDDDAVLVTTESERREEPQQKSDPIPVPVPVPVPNYDMSFYLMNMGSERKVWAGEHDDHGAASYPSSPSSIPVVNPTSEDIKRVERSPSPSIRFVDFIIIILFFRNLKPSF